MRFGIVLIFSLLFLGSAIAQTEFAKFSIGEKKYEVKIDDNIVASMSMGETVMLSATDGQGTSVTTMVPAQVGEYKATGGFTSPMLTITLSASDVYNLKTGNITITKVEGKTYTGSFKGEVMLIGEEQAQKASGTFSITLDM